MNQQKGNKKKRSVPAIGAKKPPLSNLANAARKQRRPKIAGINTITHEDENRNPNMRMSESLNLARKNNS